VRRRIRPRYGRRTGGWALRVMAVLADTDFRLRMPGLCWVVTGRPDGRPHVTPLVAVWADGAIHFHTGAELRSRPHTLGARLSWRNAVTARVKRGVFPYLAAGSGS